MPARAGQILTVWSFSDQCARVVSVDQEVSTGDLATALIAKRVRTLRTDRGWNAQQLADRMSEVGVAWQRGTVAKLENGRRASVSVEEWLSLAWVLEVSPLVLILPDDPDAEFPITPLVPSRAELVYRWIVGSKPIPAETDPEDNPGKWGSRIANYANRPGYMARSPEHDADLAERVELQEQTLQRVLAQLELIKGSQDGIDG